MSDIEFLNGPLNFDDLSILEVEYIEYENKMKNVINVLISVIIYYLFSIKNDDKKLKEEMSNIMKVINLYKNTLIVGNNRIDILMTNVPRIRIKLFSDKFEFCTALKKPPTNDIKTIIKLNSDFEILRNDKSLNINIRLLFKLLSSLDLIITTKGTDEHNQLMKILTDIYNSVNGLSPKTDGKRSNRKRSNRKRN